MTQGMVRRVLDVAAVGPYLNIENPPATLTMSQWRNA
jgi:hypothetical protein